MTGPDPHWSAARPLVLGLLTAGLLVGGIGVWSVRTSLAGAIIAPGLVEVSQSRQVVQHPDGGIVTEIRVAEGDQVAAGDILLRLDGSGLRPDLALVEARIGKLRAQRARLEAQRDDARTITFPDDLLAAGRLRADVDAMIAAEAGLFERQAQALGLARAQRQRRIGQIRAQIAGLAAQQLAVRTELRLVETELSTQDALLSRGLTEAARVLVIERDLARLHGRAGELAAAEAEALARITEVEIEIAALNTRHRELAEADLRDVVESQLELTGRARSLELRISRLDVRAPAGGIVFGLQVTTPQAVLRPADPLMFIVPQDRPLLVAARVPATHVDEVRPGQRVRLVFSSLSAGTAPESTGSVARVSADALTDERTGMPYFRAEITLDAADGAQNPAARLVPGMPVQSFIRTTDRSPFSYLLKPFTDYFRQAFRET